MVIKLKARMAGPEGNYPSGSVIDCDEKKAAQMIKGGYAVAVDEPKIVEPQKTEPPKPEFPKPPENRKLYENQKPDKKPTEKAVKKNVRK